MNEDQDGLTKWRELVHYKKLSSEEQKQFIVFVIVRKLDCDELHDFILECAGANFAHEQWVAKMIEIIDSRHVTGSGLDKLYSKWKPAREGMRSIINPS